MEYLIFCLYLLICVDFIQGAFQIGQEISVCIFDQNYIAASRPKQMVL